MLELIVVIVIIGFLAAIAFPNFLLWIQHARGSEAQQTLSSALKSQEAQHMETGKFADSWEELGLGIGQTENYEYKILAPEADESAMMRGIPKKSDLKGYVAGIEVTTKKRERVYRTAICEAKRPGTKAIEEAEVDFKKKKVVCENKKDFVKVQ